MKWIMQQKGITFIELMIVLMFLTVLSSITVLTLPSFHQAYLEKKLLHQVEEQILFCQQLAISSAQRTNCFIDNIQKRMLIRQGSRTLYHSTLDKSAQFQRGSLGLHEIEFNTKGNLRKSGTIFLTIHEKTYKLIFWIGRGRFDVEEV